MEDIDAGINWAEATNAREMNRPPKHEPKVDAAVTKIVGRPVLVNDPRLIRLVVEWKKKTASSADNVERMDFYLRNIDFLTELKKVFG